MKRRISVVIPTFNRARYVVEAVESVLNQSYTPFEIIIVDDGSTDDTSQRLELFSSEKRVRFIGQRNKGVSAARNRGIMEARGDCIAFLDSDDLWVPAHLETLVRAFQKFENCRVAFSGFEFFGEVVEVPKMEADFRLNIKRVLGHGFAKREEGIRLSSGRLLETLFRFGVPFRIQGSLIETRFIRDNGLTFDEGIRYTEEAQFVLEAALHSRMAFCEETGVLIRRHDENVGDHCYRAIIADSLERRIERLSAFFKGKLQRRPRRALQLALLHMQISIFRVRCQGAPLGTRHAEFIRLLKRVRNLRCAGCFLKFLLVEAIGVAG